MHGGVRVCAWGGCWAGVGCGEVGGVVGCCVVGCWVLGVVGVLWGVVGVGVGFRGACVGGNKSRYRSLRFIIRIPW